jgi:hypothetical protein
MARYARRGRRVGCCLILGLRPPTPTPPIRHRDAYPLLLTLEDLAGYRVVERHRLERGPGWVPEVTRLSGYRILYAGDQGAFHEVLCQVECYLSVADARTAYRVYKEQLGAEIKSNAQDAAVNESEVQGLGEWGWVFAIRSDGLETAHYVFLRENVLAEAIFTGAHTPEFSDRAVRYAQLIDQRILAR